MTTHVTVSVNGRYKAIVHQVYGNGATSGPTVVHGRYEGSPNPSGEHTFYLSHPAHSTFVVHEEYLREEAVQASKNEVPANG
ncbi:hypothetical protein [Bradyrhizobium uaiense]|uniref:Uncharacterized protein n=1 Tax=Bradyrhizobium uaiense TaxID=2594946 RepID=A0A6P1B8U2_9BRAD|nr:hypothetical protein [Bradyrhizobium uaiense]NEU94799.1 hypothetical protein [Bradyrhizobium uaiense]